MSPDDTTYNAVTVRFPRVSGDEPLTAKCTRQSLEFSPRERG